MRRRAAYRWRRIELAWMLGGLVLAQLTLGLGVDQFWPAVRDPEFVVLRTRLEERQAEARGRPLVLALGSSRTQMDLCAARLNRRTAGAPLVFNFGVPYSGPMMQQVVLRRLLDQGVYPALVFVEVMPMSLSRRGGSPLEERQLDAARLDAAEADRLLRYYHKPYHVLGPWAGARLLPTYRHQAELRAALRLDADSAGPDGEQANGIDDYGWRAGGAGVSPEERAANFRSGIEIYKDALTDPRPADGPRQSLRDLLALCRREGISAALVLPPEASPVRAFSPVSDSAIDGQIRGIAREFAVPLYDARAWVDDAGFRDPVHLATDGAERYTERFDREVFQPELLRLTAGGPLAVRGR